MPSRKVAVAGSCSHSSSVSCRPTRAVPLLDPAHVGDERRAAHEHADLEVEVERADVHVARADDRDVVVDREVLRVQDVRPRVQPDLHARPQERAVVRALGVPHRPLIADLRDEQLHLEAAQPSRGDRVHHRLVGHEVRARDDHPLLRRVHQREEQAQVVLAVEGRTARHDLAVQRIGRGVEGDDRRADVLVVGEELVGLGVPVREEHRVQRRHGRTGDARHELLPLQPALEVASSSCSCGRSGSASRCSRHGRRRPRSCGGCAGRVAGTCP